jgi:hypothetical protein
MNMLLTRYAYLNDKTLGRLELKGIDNAAEFWTIENPWQDNEPDVSCIPEGSYAMERYQSPSHGANTWQLVDVPNRTYIQLHVANYASDVLGCIGLGIGVMSNLVGVSNSRNAIDMLYSITDGMDEAGITIVSDILRG